MNPRTPARRKRQGGVAAVEFAIIAALFFTLLIGIMEMGRMLWTWNAAVEATRLGARLAVVCDQDDPTIVTRMQEMLPSFATATIDVDYLDPGNPNPCDVSTCKSVRVRLSNYTHQTIIPFLPLAVPLPAFQTTLPRESMSSAGNPVCS
jgi:hypothetical protein